jgi:hypothetical protein
MTITIDYTQACTIEEGPIYKVQTTVTYVEGISRGIFVMNTELGTFEHVATVWDMEHVVDTLAQATEEGRSYYRAEACTVEYETDTAATTFIEYTEDRIQDLATRYGRVVGEFEGTFTHHIENEE